MPCVLAAQVPPSHAGHVKNIEESIRRGATVREPTTIEARMRALNVPALSIAVVDSGRIVWAKAYGLADVARNIPATPSTRFQAASISKPVAAVAALRLVQDGMLSLDADINSLLRSWKLPTNQLTARTPVTLRMLLTHTAGTTVQGFPGYTVNAAVPTVQQILDGIARSNTPSVRVDAAPGSSWRYSGGGMTIAQLLMTDVTGEKFPELMRRLVLAPAGMTSSGYDQPLPDSLRATAAVPYGSNGAPLPGGDSHTYPEMMAAGLWTTPTDLFSAAEQCVVVPQVTGR